MTEPAVSQEPWTIGRLLDWTRVYFAGHQLEQPRLCAEILLAHALGCQKIALYTRFHEAPSPEATAAFRGLVKRAAGHEPIAYLTGTKEFFSLAFEVTADVLIPRPETETLVQQAIDEVRGRPSGRCRVLDVGTGSGCIAVALAKYLPDVRVTATDVSPAALEVARRNVDRHALADRVELLQADGLSLPAGVVPNDGFDLICSNPPYVAERDRSNLPPNVRDHEPAVALFAGPDGLDFYRLLAGGLADLLADGGAVFLEIGMGQEQAVRHVFGGSGLRHTATKPDAAGISRVVRFERR